MPPWLWIALALPLVAATVFFLLLVLTARRSDAGIVTSRLGRTLRLFWSSGWMMFRYGLRLIRRALMSKARRADDAPIADELRARLLEELDYTIEAKNQQHFIDLYRGHATIVIPRVFLDRSSRRVLTTEFLAGRGFYDFVAHASADEKRLAVHTVRDFALDSFWFHDVFNGDPHPGNYIFMGGGRVGFLDFGCVKHFDPTWIAKFKALNRLYLLGERDEYYRVACDMGFIKPGHENKVDRDWLWDYARWFYMPILEDKPFRFTADYNKKALSQIFGENMRLLNMPAEYVLLNRITFGLNSILSRLGACENWRTKSLAYFFSPDEVACLTSADADHLDSSAPQSASESGDAVTALSPSTRQTISPTSSRES